MINIDKHSGTFKSNLTFIDTFKNQAFRTILLTHNIEESSFLSKINSFVLENFLKLSLEDFIPDKIDELLKTFFVELNWKLFAKFRTAVSQESGLSLALIIIHGSNIYMVQFGRLLCGIISNNNLRNVGTNWSNFNLKTKDELLLLGSFEGDISVKIHKLTFGMAEKLIIIPSAKIDDLTTNGTDFTATNKTLNSLFRDDNFPFCLLSHKKSGKIQKENFFKNYRNRLIALFLAVIILLSAIYVLFGKNWFAEQQYVLKERNKEFANNELMEKFIEAQELLQETMNEIFTQNYDIEIFPNQKIEMEKKWSLKVGEDIISKPIFDYKQVYLIYSKRIEVYNKKNRERRWKKEFDIELNSIEILDANRLMVLLENEILLCLNRDSGDIIWQKKCIFKEHKEPSHNIAYQISLDKYKTLDTGVIIVKSKKELNLMNSINGDSLFTYRTEKDIEFLSDFDFLEKCVYIIENNELSKIVLKVMS